MALTLFQLCSLATLFAQLWLSVIGQKNAMVHTFGAACPFKAEDDVLDPVAFTNRAIHELFPLRLTEAAACIELANSAIPSSMRGESWAKAIADNYKHMQVMLGPRQGGVGRIYHGISGRCRTTSSSCCSLY